MSGLLPWPHPLINGDLELQLFKIYSAEDSQWRAPAFRFTMLLERKPSGTISLRIGQDLQTTGLAGNVGFIVEPAARGKKLAARSIRLIIPIARYYALPALWFTTTCENIASKRTIESVGATFLEIVPIPPSYDTYAKGEREKLLYCLELA